MSDCPKCETKLKIHAPVFVRGLKEFILSSLYKCPECDAFVINLMEGIE